jgi:hypothetical protein
MLQVIACALNVMERVRTGTSGLGTSTAAAGIGRGGGQEYHEHSLLPYDSHTHAVHRCVV